LADNRLVVCAEYLEPVGGGPIDNKRVHNLKESTPFAFALVFNVWHAIPSCELCLDPIYALQLLSGFGFRIVQHVLVPIADLTLCKDMIAKLPDIEGAVIYHINDVGVIQLEKSKAAHYVVVRAIREKLKRYLFGSKQSPGLDGSWQDINKRLSSVSMEELKNGKWSVDVGSMPQLATLCKQLGADFNTKSKQWVFATRPAMDPILDGMRDGFVQQLRGTLLEKVEQATTKRIEKIDHVPLSVAARHYWKTAAAAFLHHITERILSGKGASARLIMDGYSQTWADFFIEYQRVHPR